jgi:hypothetical protein
MLALSDSRRPAVVEERYGRCLYCGKALVLLPDDRRRGACYDCFSFVGLEPVNCPECATELAPSLRESGCGHCGWSPSRA